MIDPIRTGKLIAKLRQEAGWTQAQLADRVCVTHQAVSKWENGTALPDVQTLLSMSALFGVSMESLLTGQEYGAPSPAPRPEQAEAAPQPEEAAESATEDAPAASSQTPNWDNIVALAPYLPNETLTALAERLDGAADMDVMKKLAPYLPDKALVSFLERQEGASDVRTVAALAPYLPKETLMALVKRAPQDELDMDALKELAPFLPGETLSQLVMKALGQDGKPSSDKEESKKEDGRFSWSAFGAEDIGKAVSDVIQNALASLRDASMKLKKDVSAGPRRDDQDPGQSEPEAQSVNEEEPLAQFDRLNEAERDRIVEGLIDDERWDYLLSDYDRLTEGQRDRVVEGLVDSERWQDLLSLFDRFGPKARKRVLEGLADEERWDELCGLYPRLNPDERIRVVSALAQEEQWERLRPFL